MWTAFPWPPTPVPNQPLSSTARPSSPSTTRATTSIFDRIAELKPETVPGWVTYRTPGGLYLPYTGLRDTVSGRLETRRRTRLLPGSRAASRLRLRSSGRHLRHHCRATQLVDRIALR